jgi:hypothetical protein
MGQSHGKTTATNDCDDSFSGKRRSKSTNSKLGLHTTEPTSA